MKQSEVFAALLSSASKRRLPFGEAGPNMKLRGEFLGGGSWAGDVSHHSAFVEFILRPAPTENRDRQGNARLARGMIRSAEGFFKSFPGTRFVEFGGREVEGSFRGVWQLQSKAWDMTAILNMTIRPRGGYWLSSDLWNPIEAIEAVLRVPI